MNPQEQPLDQDVVRLAKAIARTETGQASPEAYSKRGASGEIGRYQFMPSTYKDWAKTHLGDENAPMTVDNQNKVAYSQIKQWKDQGLTPAQIASKWNSGRENAYKEGFVGTNDKGVKFDVPGYVEKVSRFYQEEKGGQPTAPVQQQPAMSMPGLTFAEQQPETSVQQERADLMAQGQPVSRNEEKSNPTMGGNIVRGIIRPFVRGINTPIQGIQKLAGQENINTYDPYLGDISGLGMKEGQTAGQRVKDVVGGVAEIAANFIPVAKGAKVLGTLGKGMIGQAVKQTAKVGAVAGGLALGGQALQEDKGVMGTIQDVGTGIVTGALTAGTLGLGGGLIGKAVSKKVAQDIDVLIGAVTRGDKEAVRTSQKALSEFNMGELSSIKSSDDFVRNIDAKIQGIKTKLDEVLNTKGDLFKLKDLDIKTKVGQFTVKQNHVDDALTQLELFYTKTNNMPEVARIKDLRLRAKTQGLTVKEINQLAKEHGSNLNGFNANGELASGLSKQAAENTRAGLKSTGRDLFGNEAYEIADKSMSNLITLRGLVSDFSEKVAKAKQVAIERGFGAKAMDKILKIADYATAGGLKRFGQFFIESGVGNKTLDYLGLEKALSKNLKLIEEILGKNLPEASIIQKLDDILRNTVKPQTVKVESKFSSTPKSMAEVKASRQKDLIINEKSLKGVQNPRK